MRKITMVAMLALLVGLYSVYPRRELAKARSGRLNPTGESNRPSNLVLRNKAQGLPKLTGGFIQLGDLEKRLPVGKWADLLDELKTKSGVDTIIVQALFFQDAVNHHYIVLSQGTINVDNPKYDPKMVLAANDPTNAILTYADTHGLEVYLGLWMQDLSFPTVAAPLSSFEDYLRNATSHSIATAELVWSLYHQHPSFHGWYIPYELWNFPFGDQGTDTIRKQEAIKQFIKNVGDKCRDLNSRKESDGKGKDRPIAISAFFNPWFDQSIAGPAVVRLVFESILKGSDLDLLIIQDSVGAKCLGNESLDDGAKQGERDQIKRTTLPEYLKAFYNAAKAAGSAAHPIKLWDDLEAYQTVSRRCPTDRPEASLPFEPSNIERLKWQLNVAVRDPITSQPYLDPNTNQPIQIFERFVVFDFFHYMNTVIPDGYGTDRANSQLQRSKLFNDYLRELRNNSSFAPVRSR